MKWNIVHQEDNKWLITSDDSTLEHTLDVKPCVYDNTLIYYTNNKTFIAKDMDELVNRKRFVNGFLDFIHDYTRERISSYTVIYYYMDKITGTYYISRKPTINFKQIINIHNNKPIRNITNMVYRTDNLIDGYLVIESNDKTYISNVYTLWNMYEIPPIDGIETFEHFKLLCRKYGPNGIRYIP